MLLENKTFRKFGLVAYAAEEFNKSDHSAEKAIEYAGVCCAVASRIFSDAAHLRWSGLLLPYGVVLAVRSVQLCDTVNIFKLNITSGLSGSVLLAQLNVVSEVYMRFGWLLDGGKKSSVLPSDLAFDIVIESMKKSDKLLPYDEAIAILHQIKVGKGFYKNINDLEAKVVMIVGDLFDTGEFAQAARLCQLLSEVFLEKERRVSFQYMSDCFDNEVFILEQYV